MTNASTLFGSSNGSENFYQSVTNIIYTDGVKEMAEQCDSYWLIDLIASYQEAKKKVLHPFQIWELKRITNDKFHVRAMDGRGKMIASQIIPFSDFKYDQAILWLVDGCIMLPKEY